MKKISGYLLIILGFLHASLGIVSGWQQVKAIFAYGMWNALGQEPQAICMHTIACLQINTITWFIFFGLMLILFGVICVFVETQLRQTIPGFIGWILLLISAVGALLLPVSGYWLVMAVAINMIIAAKRSNKKVLTRE